MELTYAETRQHILGFGNRILPWLDILKLNRLGVKFSQSLTCSHSIVVWQLYVDPVRQRIEVRKSQLMQELFHPFNFVGSIAKLHL